MPRCLRTQPTRPKAGMRRLKGPTRWRNKARKSRRSLSEARELILTPYPSQTPRTASRCNSRALFIKVLTKNAVLVSQGVPASRLPPASRLSSTSRAFQLYRPSTLSASAKASSTVAPLSIPAQSSGTQLAVREGRAVTARSNQKRKASGRALVFGRAMSGYESPPTTRYREGVQVSHPSRPSRPFPVPSERAQHQQRPWLHQTHRAPSG